jgi:CubicO group peptidase (beta-lactamase class C family)
LQGEQKGVAKLLHLPPMSLRSIFYLLAILVFLNSCTSHSGSENSNDPINEQNKQPDEKTASAELHVYRKKLSAYFDTMLLNRNFNGSILVAKNGNILYETYMGYANPMRYIDTITETTTFHLASASKPFTGMAIMKLIENGTIGIDDAITKYFPQLPYPNVTIRNLLTHRSGLPNYLYFMDDKQKWNPSATITNKDVIDFLIKYQPPKTAAPGNRFQYCNTNFVLLASIIEKVTGKSFPQYMKETIFDPLGMKNTFVFTPADSGKTLMSYKPSGALWMNDQFEYTYGDKNIYSTPRDMLKWDNALYNKNFISKTILDSAFLPRSNEKPSIHNYGYAWRMLNLPNGKKIIYHFGKWHGFNAAFAHLADEKVMIVILGNRYNNRIYEAAKEAYHIFGEYTQASTSNEENDIQPKK